MDTLILKSRLKSERPRRAKKILKKKNGCVCARAEVDAEHIGPRYSEPIPVWEPGTGHLMSDQWGKGDLNVKRYWNYQNGKSKNPILYHDPK